MDWERIDNYRNKTGQTLDQVAKAIGVGKSMLMMVKSGKRHLSSKALYRLEQAELEAGISSPENITESHNIEEQLVSIGKTLLEIRFLLSQLLTRIPQTRKAARK